MSKDYLVFFNKKSKKGFNLMAIIPTKVSPEQIKDTLKAYGNDLQLLIQMVGNSPKEIRITEDMEINTNLTIPSNIHLIIREGSRVFVNENTIVNGRITCYSSETPIFNIASGKTLTLNGPFTADLNRIFNGLGTALFPSTQHNVKEVYPQWWGTSNNIHTAAISSALGSLINGGRLIFTKQVFNTSGILINTNKTHIVIEQDAEIKIIGKTGDPYYLISVLASDVSISGVGVLNGNRDNLEDPNWSCHIIRIVADGKSIDNITVKDISIKDAPSYTGGGGFSRGDGIYISKQGNSAYTISNVRISNCKISNCGRNGISVIHCDSGLIISGNNIIGAKQCGIDIEPSMLNKHIVEGALVTGNTIDCQSLGGRGIDAGGEACSFTNNIIKNPVSAGIFLPEHDSKSNNISGNSIIRSGKYGIWVPIKNYGSHLITNNIVNIAGRSGIYIQKGWNIVTNNIVKDAGTILGNLQDIQTATSANPCVITLNNHGLSVGDRVRLSGFSHADWKAKLNGVVSAISIVNDNQFSLTSIDTSGLPAFSGRGRIESVKGGSQNIGIQIVDQKKNIEALSRSNPMILTWTNHPFSEFVDEDPDDVRKFYVQFTGIKQADWVNLNYGYREVEIIDSTSLSVVGLNSSGFAAAYDAEVDPGKVNVDYAGHNMFGPNSLENTLGKMFTAINLGSSGYNDVYPQQYIGDYTYTIRNYLDTDYIRGTGKTTIMISNRTLKPEETGGIFTNRPDEEYVVSSDTTTTLPIALAPLEFTFISKNSNYFMNIKPASGEEIIGYGVNGLVDVGAEGSILQIRCTVDGKWDVVAHKKYTRIINSIGGTTNLQARDTGNTYTNTDATANSTYNLPAAVPGLEYRFIRTHNTRTIIVSPNGSDFILEQQTGLNFGTGSGPSGATLRCFVPGRWEVTHNQRNNIIKDVGVGVTLNRNDKGNFFINDSAGNNTTVTLHEATELGIEYTFMRTSANRTFTIVPNANDTIQGLNQAESLVVGNQYSIVTLRCVRTNFWAIVRRIST